MVHIIEFLKLGCVKCSNDFNFQVSELGRVEDTLLLVQGQEWFVAKGHSESCLRWKPLRKDGEGESVKKEELS